MGLFGWVLTAAAKTLTGTWGHDIYDECKSRLVEFRVSHVSCRGDICSCLDLQACLQRLLQKAAQQRPALDALIEEEVHLLLPDYFSDINNIKDCPHVAATQLAVADAFYKLIAMPEYRRREQAAAAAPAAAALVGLQADASEDGYSPLELIARSYSPPECAASFMEDLQAKWTEVLQRLQVAAEALPPDNKPLKPANASKLSVCICEGPKGIGSKLDGLLQPSHTVILWAAAVCRMCTDNIFIGYMTAGCPRAAVIFVRKAAALAATMLDVTTTMGRLSAAGISFNTQPSPAAVAAAIDLAAQVNAALSPYQYAEVRKEKAFFEKNQQQRQQQPEGPQPLPLLPLLPLYFHPLQQQQQQKFVRILPQLRRLNEVAPTGETPQQAHTAFQYCEQFWALGAPVICFHGCQLLQRWEQQLLQQGDAVPCHPAAAAAAVADGGADAGSGGGSSGSCDGNSSNSSNSSSSSRAAWQEAEGMLLLCAVALAGPFHQGQQQQQLQQQLALCRQYQQQFQQAATNLGLSRELMAAVAACFTETEQYSSSSGSGGGGSSSEGAAAGSDAAADCLSSVCAALLLLMNVYAWVDPLSRSQAPAGYVRQRVFTAAEELLVADFFLQVPGLVTAAAGAAFLMAAQQGGAPAPAPAAAAAAGTGAVLSQLPLLAHLLQQYRKNWPSLTRLLCGQLTAEEQAAMVGAGLVWKQLQQQWRKKGRTKVCAQFECVAAGLVLLGNNSILLQQLLRTAAAAEGQQPLQQQQQLAAAVLYCADSLGDQVGGLWAHLWLMGPGSVSESVSESVSRFQPCRIVTMAVQAFEAAVRHLVCVGIPLRSAGVPPAAAAAGSTLQASSSSSGGSGSSSGSNTTSNSRAAVPPSITQVELTAVKICSASLKATNHPVSSTSSSSSSSSRPVTGLHRTEYELLQAALSMLLTSAKLCQAGRQLPLPVELLWKIATPVAAGIRLAGASQSGTATPGTPAAAAAAAAMVAAEAAGGVQLCHIVARYLGCCEQQLRRCVASGDAVGTADWLSGTANQDVVPLPFAGNGSGQAAAAAAPPRRLQAIALTVQASCEIALAASGGPSEGLGVQREGDRVDRCFRGTLANLIKLLQAQGADKTRKQGGNTVRSFAAQTLKWMDLEDALLESVGGLADALQGFGSVLAASVPSRFGCNWPGCVRLSGVSEGYGLVRGQACVCGGCRQARYCSVACQAAHWPAHKAFCQQHQQHGAHQQPRQQQAGASASVAPTAAAATTGT